MKKQLFVVTVVGCDYSEVYCPEIDDYAFVPEPDSKYEYVMKVRARSEDDARRQVEEVIKAGRGECIGKIERAS
ncbi:MAG: hypothetical protein G01um10142_166 [Parcubacteria group bacterium Gr01-1014_2]|nr:MAG: hypothetical protein G01um10142_166 [Parcubacteria group bacterium Gr01-1014_2]